ncbi:MAG: hypothetical protein ACI8ZF_000927 [Candidatus Midichloriaceae bacterium]|jgi:hypothetical protein
MSDFALKEQEKAYFEAISEFVKKQYEEHLADKSKDLEIDPEEFSKKLAESLGVETEGDKFDKFNKDIEKGFEKLAKEFEDLAKKNLSSEEFMKETKLSAKLDKLNREADYEKNPTFVKGVMNALKNFAEYISESVSNCFGKSKSEAIPLLTEAFKNQKESIFKEVDKNMGKTGHQSAIEEGDRIKENRANSSALQDVGFVILAVGTVIKNTALGRNI